MTNLQHLLILELLLVSTFSSRTKFFQTGDLVFTLLMGHKSLINIARFLKVLHLFPFPRPLSCSQWRPYIMAAKSLGLGSQSSLTWGPLFTFFSLLSFLASILALSSIVITFIEHECVKYLVPTLRDLTTPLGRDELINTILQSNVTKCYNNKVLTMSYVSN